VLQDHVAASIVLYDPDDEEVNGSDRLTPGGWMELAVSFNVIICTGTGTPACSES